MLGSARHHETFARPQDDDPVAEFDAEFPFPDQEEFIFVGMLVPGEFALDLDELDFLTVQASDHLGTPVFAEERELFRQADFCAHVLPNSISGLGTGSATFTRVLTSR